MANQVILNRQQLSEFLQNPESIKAFESLFALVFNNTPNELSEILQLLGSGNFRNGPNLQPVLNRIEEGEQQKERKPNLTELINRINELEQIVQQKQNLMPLLRRIEAIENFIGI